MSGFFDTLKDAGTGYFNQVVSDSAAKYGINISTAPVAKPKAVGGVATQIPESSVISTPWFKKPIVIVAAGLAVIALLWVLVKKR